MNKQEKLIALLLGCVLAWWLWHSTGSQKQAADETSTQETQPASTSAPSPVNDSAVTTNAVVTNAVAQVEPAVSPSVRPPEEFRSLGNDEIELRLSTYGAVIKSATMLKFAKHAGVMSDENPALVMDFAEAPALALSGVEGMASDEDFGIKDMTSDAIVFTNRFMERTIRLETGYKIKVDETFLVPENPSAVNYLSLGTVAMGASKNDILSVDSLSRSGKKDAVVHHGDDGDSPLKEWLVTASGGCGGSRNVSELGAQKKVDVAGRQGWIAVKNRFFVSALVDCTEDNEGFQATVTRDTGAAQYVLKSVNVAPRFAGIPRSRSYTLFIGPKKQALLWDQGMKDVMEFGMWRWLCYPIVWVLNLSHSLIPNYGVAIILLTILVRLLFWPLTHKSTVGMRKMQEIQPKVKEIQVRYKDNPQRMQMEVWQIYRENHVNPLSSCLPMLLQIPVFIALFNVLRSAVELRYAPFLWISDLSEPEALFASWFPFGGLNVLPLLMAALTMLQSAFSPSSGDNKQQRTMMIMMPLIMLFMFYNFPSALSLYWALSTAFSVLQSWWIRRKYGPSTSSGAGGVLDPDSVEMPRTRQMRRHGGN